MDSVEKLCVAQAVYKVASEVVSTNTPGNLRSQVDERYKELFETTGAKSFEVRVGDEKVGTYSVRLTKPEKKSFLKVADAEAFKAWCEDNDCITTKCDIDKATLMLEETGVLPDGCSVVTIDKPGGEWKGGTLKVDPLKVNNALDGAVIPPALLEGDVS